MGEREPLTGPGRCMPVNQKKTQTQRTEKGGKGTILEGSRGNIWEVKVNWGAEAWCVLSEFGCGSVLCSDGGGNDLEPGGVSCGKPLEGEGGDDGGDCDLEPRELGCGSVDDFGGGDKISS